MSITPIDILAYVRVFIYKLRKSTTLIVIMVNLLKGFRKAETTMSLRPAIFALILLFPAATAAAQNGAGNADPPFSASPPAQASAQGAFSAGEDPAPVQLPSGGIQHSG